MSAQTESSRIWRKRVYDCSSMESFKKRRISFQSESEEDTESISSIQGKETDLAFDTSDTELYEGDSEYEIASLSTEDEQDPGIISSSSESDERADIALVAAAALCDEGLFETWVTDGEDSENSSDEGHSIRAPFVTCLLCKKVNTNTLFPYCKSCFQVRKTFFPPRPRKNKKIEDSKKADAAPVKLETLRSCLNGILSQDSGIGSSQEFPALALDQIVVPSTSSSSGTEEKHAGDELVTRVSDSNNRKRRLSESSPSEREAKKTRIDCTLNLYEDVKPALAETPPEMCNICCSTPKNSVFLHGDTAHMYCCLKCAKRTWKLNKRCPMCNRKINKVAKFFKA